MGNSYVDVLSQELDQLHAQRRKPRFGFRIYARLVGEALIEAMKEAGL